MEFIRNWIVGVGTAWALMGFMGLYVYCKGPLPSTDKYIEEKYEKRLPLLEQLNLSESEIPPMLEKRHQNRVRWRKLREEEQKKRNQIVK